MALLILEYYNLLGGKYSGLPLPVHLTVWSQMEHPNVEHSEDMELIKSLNSTVEQQTLKSCGSVGVM